MMATTNQQAVDAAQQEGCNPVMAERVARAVLSWAADSIELPALVGVERGNAEAVAEVWLREAAGEVPYW